MFSLEKNYPHKEDKQIFFALTFVIVSIILRTSLEIGTLFNLAGTLLIVIPASSIIILNNRVDFRTIVTEWIHLLVKNIVLASSQGGSETSMTSNQHLR